MAEEVVLKIIGGNLKGEEFVFDEKGLCLIGRSADCALQIPKEKDMKISRRHCLLILDPPNVRVRDLGSRNGTYVNDEMLQPGVISSIPENVTPVDRVLKHGDRIDIGECALLIDIPSQQSQGYIVPQIKPHANSSASIQSQLNSVANDTPSLTPNRPATVSNISPTSPVTSTSRRIAVTEIMSRDEIRGVANISQNHVHSNEAEKVRVDNLAADQTHQAPPRATPQQQMGKLVSNNNTSGSIILQPGVSHSDPGTPVANLSPNPVPVIKQPGVLHSKSGTPPVPVIKKPGRKTGTFAPLGKVVDPGPLSPPPPAKTPTLVLSKKNNSKTTSINNPRPVLKAKIVSKPDLNAETTIAPAPQVLSPEDAIIEKAPTDRIKTGIPHDKYQDTIVMDPTEMDSMPDLVSATVPEVENTRRVAKFKIKGLK